MDLGFSVVAALTPVNKKLPDLIDGAKKNSKTGGKNDNAQQDSNAARFIELSRKTLRLLDRRQQEKAMMIVDKMGELSAKVINEHC